MKQINVDVGGTFTDCFVVYEDQRVETKSITTHHNVAIGFMDALSQAAEVIGLDGAASLLSEADSVRYATTLGTNALIEHKGPNVALLVTAGFESSVPLSRGKGYGVGMSPGYQADVASASRPVPLVPIDRIRGVHERIDYKGDIVLALAEEQLRAQIRELVDAGAQAFVVSFVNSVVNPLSVTFNNSAGNYTVSGTGTANITYKDGALGSQLSNQTLPFDTVVQGAEQNYTLTGTLNSNDPGGKITCTIKIPGLSPVIETASGANASVTCQASAT